MKLPAGPPPIIPILGLEDNCKFNLMSLFYNMEKWKEGLLKSWKQDQKQQLWMDKLGRELKKNVICIVTSTFRLEQISILQICGI